MSIAQQLSKNHDVSVFWDNQKDIDRIVDRFHLDLSSVQRVKNIFSPTISTLQRLMQSRTYDICIVLSDGSIPLVACKKLFLHIQQPLHTSQTKNLWEKFKLSRVTKIFCNSTYTKSFLPPLLRDKTTIIYPSVPIMARKVEKQNWILHVGRFRVKNIANGDYKKQSVMVEAFKKVVDKGLKNWKFVLAVSIQDKDKEEFEEMKKSAKNYPVEFFINKSNSELWDLYSKSKIYWHASGYGEDLVKHPEFAEHFGISTVEAMGAGCVPIVINAGGQKEIVTDSKNGYLWNTLSELEEKTLFLIKNTKKLEILSENAKKRAADFTEVEFAQKIEKLIV